MPVDKNNWGLPAAVVLVTCLTATVLIAPEVAGAAKSMRQVWTAWSNWSHCSFTCGQGVQSRYRDCVGHTDTGLVRLEKPVCRGRSREYVICKRQPCSPGIEGDREVQCSEHNKEIVVGNVYHWIPFYGGLNPCQLTCLARGYSFYYNFGHVKDGTRCKKDSADLCVGGRCMAVGCDNYVGSRAEVDQCGVCGGRNVGCVFYQKTYTRPLPKSGEYGYTQVVKIPSGSTHLKVQDRSNNYLALADSRMTYIINGNWVIDWPGRYQVAGTTIYYSRSGSDNETITADGPIKEDLHLMLIFRERNPGVTYKFWILKESLSQVKEDGYRAEPSSGSQNPHRPAFGVLPGGSRTPLSKVKQPRGKQLPSSGGRVGSGHMIRQPLKPEHYDKRRTRKSQNVLSKSVEQTPSRASGGPDSYDVSMGVIHTKRHGVSTGSRVPGTAVGGATLSSQDPGHTEGSAPNVWWNAGKLRHQKKQLDFPDRTSNVGPQLDDRSRGGHPGNGNDQVPTTTRPRPTQSVSNSPTPPLKRAKRRKGQKHKKRRQDGANSIIPKKHSCAPCIKVKDRLQHFCSSQFVVHLVVLAEDHPGEGNDTRYDVRILQRYRDTLSLLTREYIWVPNRCRCPRLNRNKEYVVMGNLVTDTGTRESRLQLNRGSFVRAYNLANANRMRTRVPRANCEKYG